MHALDWPFVSELERARWKARCLRAAALRLTSILTSAADELAEAALAIRRALPAGGSTAASRGGSTVASPGEAEAARNGAGESAQHGAEPTVVALKQQVRALSTAIQLDASAAIGMVQEAAQLCAPVLSYVALGDIGSASEG